MITRRAPLAATLAASLAACAGTAPRAPLSINSPQLDSGIRGNGGGGLGGEQVVGKPEGNAGVVSRVVVP